MKYLSIPRLGTPRVNRQLVEEVLKAKALGATDVFWTTGPDKRQYKVTRKSSADLYQRMMAAKGLVVQVGQP